MYVGIGLGLLILLAVFGRKKEKTPADDVSWFSAFSISVIVSAIMVVVPVVGLHFAAGMTDIAEMPWIAMGIFTIGIAWVMTGMTKKAIADG